MSSTVRATDPLASGAYNAATTYAAGTVVQVDSPTFTFTASGAVLTATAHGWANNDTLQVSSSGTLPAGLTAGVLYYIIQADTDTLKLSLTKGGSPITTTSAGAGTHTPRRPAPPRTRATRGRGRRRGRGRARASELLELEREDRPRPQGVA